MHPIRTLELLVAGIRCQLALQDASMLLAEARSARLRAASEQLVNAAAA